MCIHAHTQKHPCQPLDTNGGGGEGKRQTHSQLANRKRSTEILTEHLITASTGKAIEWMCLCCPISSWQHHRSYRDLKSTAWIAFEIWTQALHDSCAPLWTGRTNILYGKYFSVKLIINNLGRETVLRLRQILFCQAHFNEILKVINVLPHIQHVFPFILSS